MAGVAVLATTCAARVGVVASVIPEPHTIVAAIVDVAAGIAAALVFDVIRSVRLAERSSEALDHPTTPAAEERSRQERETFDQRKKQDGRWFALRLTMGFVVALLLPVLAFVAAYVLFYHEDFPPSVVTSAGAALFADVTGLLVAAWKLVLNPQSATRLEPLTPAGTKLDGED